MRIAKLLLTIIAWLALAAGASAFDFGGYAGLLERYMVADRVISGVPVNVIDYARMYSEQGGTSSDWQTLLAGLTRFDPDTLTTNEERMAFWINVYNIAAIKAILDHYPVDSIRSRSIHWLRQPWKKLGIEVGGEFYSLHRIEFDLLIEGFRDLRVHFAVNCASVSCPDLRAEPFDAGNLERQLREQGERFAAQAAKGLSVNREKGEVKVSQVFRFDRDRFDEWAGGPVAFLLSFVPEGPDRDFLASGDFDLEYLEYDWTLNDVQRAER